MARYGKESVVVEDVGVFEGSGVRADRLVAHCVLFRVTNAGRVVVDGDVFQVVLVSAVCGLRVSTV